MCLFHFCGGTVNEMFGLAYLLSCTRDLLTPLKWQLRHLLTKNPRKISAEQVLGVSARS